MSSESKRLLERLTLALAAMHSKERIQASRPYFEAIAAGLAVAAIPRCTCRSAAPPLAAALADSLVQASRDGVASPLQSPATEC